MISNIICCVKDKIIASQKVDKVLCVVWCNCCNNITYIVNKEWLKPFGSNCCILFSVQRYITTFNKFQYKTLNSTWDAYTSLFTLLIFDLIFSNQAIESWSSKNQIQNVVACYSYLKCITSFVITFNNIPFFIHKNYLKICFLFLFLTGAKIQQQYVCILQWIRSNSIHFTLVLQVRGSDYMGSKVNWCELY